MSGCFEGAALWQAVQWSQCEPDWRILCVLNRVGVVVISNTCPPFGRRPSVEPACSCHTPFSRPHLLAFERRFVAARFSSRAMGALLWRCVHLCTRASPYLEISILVVSMCECVAKFTIKIGQAAQSHSHVSRVRAVLLYPGRFAFILLGGDAVHYTRCKNLASMIFRFQLTLSTLLRAGLQST